MARTYEQEMLDIESARISSELAYHKEVDVLLNKPLFSKKQVEEIKKKLPYYFGLGFVCGMVFCWIISKIN